MKDLMETHFLGKVAQKAVIVRNGEVLLVRDPRNPDIWELPGGRLNDGEEPAIGLAREIFEELGAKIQVKTSGVAIPGLTPRGITPPESGVFSSSGIASGDTCFNVTLIPELTLGDECDELVKRPIFVEQFIQGSEGQRALMIAYEAELPEGEELKPDPSEVAEFCFVPIGEALQLNLYPTYQKVLASL